MNQDIFDNIIEFALSVITSKEYLNDLNIFVSDILYDDSLKEFVKNFNNKKTKPGLYPVANNVDLSNFEEEDQKEIIDTLGDCVHWYAIREDKNKGQLILNGYPSKSPEFEIEYDKNRSFGLNAQEEGSHSFCQAISLISFLGEENILSEKLNDQDRYHDNVSIIVNWLKKFTKENDFNWDINDRNIYNFLKKETINYLINRYKEVKNNHIIKLSLLFNFISLKTNYKYLETWFDGEENDSECFF